MCAGLRPTYPTAEDVRTMSDSLARKILADNEAGVANGFWKTAQLIALRNSLAF